MSSCDLCGEDISSSNMARHRGGARCEISAHWRQMYKDGYAAVPGSYGPMLRKLGYQTILGPARYDRGFKGRAQKVYDGHWAPAILVEIIERRTKGVMTFVGPVKLPLKMIKMHLRVMIKHLNTPRLEN